MHGAVHGAVYGAVRGAVRGAAYGAVSSQKVGKFRISKGKDMVGLWGAVLDNHPGRVFLKV